MKRVALLVAPLALSYVLSCTVHGSTLLRRPDGATVHPNVVRVPNMNGDEELLALPAGSLTSEASLVRLDEQACFDVIVRTWQGATAKWTTRLLADGEELAASPWETKDCRAGCVPKDAQVAAKPTDTHEKIKARGGRVCLAVSSAAREAGLLALQVEQGAYTLSFEWRLSDHAR